MKKANVIATLLTGFLGLTVQIHASPQESGATIKQKVSKAAKKAAVQARVHYQGSPQFASIEGTSTTYATNALQPVLNIGDTFYFSFNYFNPVVRSNQNVWLVSASAQGPWVPAYSVPQQVPAIVCAQISADPSDLYQLCALPRPT